MYTRMNFNAYFINIDDINYDNEHNLKKNVLYWIPISYFTLFFFLFLHFCC